MNKNTKNLNLQNALNIINDDKLLREQKAMEYLQKAIEHIEQEYNVIVFITPPQPSILKITAK